MYKFYVLFSFDYNGHMSASDTYVLADTYQEALKMAYVLAEQRYWSWDNSKELFGIIVSKVDEKF